MSAFPTRRRLALACVAAALALISGACGGSDDEPSTTGATVPVESTTTSTAPADPYAIPSDPSKIDKEYVDRVLAALSKVDGDAFRRYVETKQLSPLDLVPLRAIYNDPEFQGQAEAFAKTPIRAPEEYHQPIGDRKITVNRLLTARLDCISAEVTYDASAIRLQAPPPLTRYLALRHKQPGADPKNFNPTPWAIAWDGDQPEDKCVA
jgi:hypothetical protein